mmetsp:Transcript_43464/g.68059  ORF Transcript_43464/g.68059 Transcript_43464/m.68059 type:complete len:161 (+) Transcript_43464:170-652(+)
MLRVGKQPVALALRCLSAAAVPTMASAFLLSRPLTMPALAPVKSFSSGQMKAFSSPLVASRPAVPFFGLRMSSGPQEDTVVAGMEKKLEAEFSPTKLEVIPAYGDPNGSHVAITVVSEKFEGKRAMQRQQMVYKVIWEEMQGPIHAVDSMTCKTPAEMGS